MFSSCYIIIILCVFSSCYNYYNYMIQENACVQNHLEGNVGRTQKKRIVMFVTCIVLYYIAGLGKTLVDF